MESPPHGVFESFRVPGVDTLKMTDTIGKDHRLLTLPDFMFKYERVNRT